MFAIATAAALSVPISLCCSSKLNNKRGVRGGFRVLAIIGDDGRLVERKSAWTTLFDVEDPRSKVPQYKGKFLDAYQALEVARHDIQYCDWKARQDVLTIMLLHGKEHLKKKELAELQEELAQAHNQVHISEARVSTALDKLAHMETLVNDKILQERNTTESDSSPPTPSTPKECRDTGKSRQGGRSLNVSGPIDCFEEPWVLFRGKDGKPGCVQDTCAHRACPLHLGSVNEGRIQCPYHGWEYSTNGKCEKMPSTRLVNVKIKALPCFEQEGMIWIWPGDDPPTAKLPSLLPPSGFQIHAEIVMELPVEHGLLLDNLLDVAHAPFTHTSTFAKGWSVPSLVKFLGPATGLQGYWDPYPIDMEFRPPCMVLNEDLGVIAGQQERMLNGANVWNLPVSYDKLGVRYRTWTVTSGAPDFCQLGLKKID
ncbi:UNVERIFIED_CONTAM: Chlorophyllide a oxygenase, chloroplastic [Sesamum radiatum]|uniref:Chlorophyllide a oxygenase, chloroplastic n=1 Tax=Sesamum radiatum TaxID=300843 RepID=A0AAW2QDJ6_SESRA